MNINHSQYGIPYQGGQRAGVFRREYAKNHDANSDPNRADEAEKEAPKSYREQILEKMEEMAENIRKGTIQPKFQIGAQEYTIKEWEKLLEKFDASEEAMQAAVKEHIEEVEKQAEAEAMRRAAENGTLYTGKMIHVAEAAVTKTSAVEMPAATGTSAAMEMPAATGTAAKPAGTETVSGTEEDLEETAALLTDEITKCSYPVENSDQKHWYITCYGQDGISCKEAYFDGTKWVNRSLWSLSYTEKGQYEKVMTFLQRFPQDANLRFAAHENFWKDFLAGEIDEDDFAAFFETTKDGVPDYTYEKDGSTYIDPDKAKYAKYMNHFGAQLYTREEMELIQRAILNENRKGLQKLSDDGTAMPVSDGGKQQDLEEEEIGTQIVTKADGSVVLQITTQYGVMELEVTQAQKFGLQAEVSQDRRSLARNAQPMRMP